MNLNGIRLAPLSTHGHDSQDERTVKDLVIFGFWHPLDSQNEWNLIGLAPLPTANQISFILTVQFF